jgi:hypothetical protein
MKEVGVLQLAGKKELCRLRELSKNCCWWWMAVGGGLHTDGSIWGVQSRKTNHQRCIAWEMLLLLPSKLKDRNRESGGS